MGYHLCFLCHTALSCKPRPLFPCLARGHTHHTCRVAIVVVVGLSQRIETFVRPHIYRSSLASPPYLAINEWVAAREKVGCGKSTHGLHNSSAFVAVDSPEEPTSGGFPLRPAAKAQGRGGLTSAQSCHILQLPFHNATRCLVAWWSPRRRSRQ